jgi:hypothetical protein
MRAVSGLPGEIANSQDGSTLDFGHRHPVQHATLSENQASSPACRLLLWRPEELLQVREIVVDGGVWANDPVMAGIVEALAWLRVPLNRIDVLSVGTTSDVYSGRDTLDSGLFGWLRKIRLLKLFIYARCSCARRRKARSSWQSRFSAACG